MGHKMMAGMKRMQERLAIKNAKGFKLEMPESRPFGGPSGWMGHPMPLGVKPGQIFPEEGDWRGKEILHPTNDRAKLTHMPRSWSGTPAQLDVWGNSTGGVSGQVLMLPQTL